MVGLKYLLDYLFFHKMKTDPPFFYTKIFYKKEGGVPLHFEIIVQKRGWSQLPLANLFLLYTFKTFRMSDLVCLRHFIYFQLPPLQGSCHRSLNNVCSCFLPVLASYNTVFQVFLGTDRGDCRWVKACGIHSLTGLFFSMIPFIQ